MIPSDAPASKSTDFWWCGMTRGDLELRQRLSYTHSKDKYDSCVTTLLKLKRAETLWEVKEI